ncbi:MAG TPA: hypothetical protein VKA15_27525, partial [Isosphaeraceae bacterium]|nr:hypothetical protein [Isosphaeraceae bacterium]
QQMLALGLSYKLTDDIVLSLAWTHQFRNSISGPILQIPGERIKLDAQLDSIVMGLNVQFGGPRKHADNTISGGGDSLPAMPAGSASPDSPPAGFAATPPPAGITATPPPVAADGPAVPATLPSTPNVVSE